jgi:quinol monooxygenase YgiN
MRNIHKNLMVALALVFSIGITNTYAQENSELDPEEALVFIFSFKVKPENQKRYDEVRKQQFQITEGEEGTLQYEVFRDENGVYCQFEQYANEQALFTHVQNTSKQLQEWMQLTEPIQTIALGNVSDELKKQFQLKEVYKRYARVQK